MRVSKPATTGMRTELGCLDAQPPYDGVHVTDSGPKVSSTSPGGSQVRVRVGGRPVVYFWDPCPYSRNRGATRCTFLTIVLSDRDDSRGAFSRVVRHVVCRNLASPSKYPKSPRQRS